MIAENKSLLPELHVLTLLKQVAEGLIALHERSLVHCNLSLVKIQVFRLEVQNDCNEVLVKLGGFNRVADLSQVVADCSLPWKSGLVPPEVMQQGARAWSPSGDV